MFKTVYQVGSLKYVTRKDHDGRLMISEKGIRTEAIPKRHPSMDM